MEEKERYYYDGLGEDIYDSEIDDYPSNKTICDTLNQQYRQIKSLEEENQKLKESIELLTTSKGIIDEHKPAFCNLAGRNCECLSKEKQLAINELESLKYFIDNTIEIENDIGVVLLEEFYNKQIKNLRGE